MTDRERRFADASRVVDESVVMRVVTAITKAVAGPPIDSRRLTAALKGPFYVLAAAAGCLTHALLLQLMPDRLAPVRPLAYGMVLAFAAFAAAAAGFITTRSSSTATADSSAGTAKT